MLNNYHDIKDEEIVEKINNGEHEQFEILYEKYVPYLENIVFNRVQNYKYTNKTLKNIDVTRETEDLLGEIMDKIFGNIGDYNPNLASFKTWITRIAINHLYDWVGKGRFYIWNSDRSELYEEKEDIMHKIPSKEMSPFEMAFLKTIVNSILKTIQYVEKELLRDYLICKFGRIWLIYYQEARMSLLEKLSIYGLAEI